MKPVEYVFDFNCLVNGVYTQGMVTSNFENIPVVTTANELAAVRESIRKHVENVIHPGATDIRISMPFALPEKPEAPITKKTATKNANRTGKNGTQLRKSKRPAKK